MIEQLRSPHGDNYSYVVYGEPGGDALLVDPVAEDPVQSTLDELSLTPSYVINTHGHGDHTSGNETFMEMGAGLAAHTKEASRINGVDRTLEDRETLRVGNLEMTVHHTPGHSSGSICLTTSDALLAGDTVFLAGCGNPKFGGDTRRLFESFKAKIRHMDDDLILYPGHDYAERNLQFARSVEPDNPAIEEKLNEVQNLSTDEEPRSTLAEEKRYNPFLRFDDEGLIKNLSNLPSDPTEWDVFKQLRELRNRW